MADNNAVSGRAAGPRRGKAPHAGAAAATAAVAAVIVFTGTACSTVTSGAAVRVKAPEVIVLKQGADNGNGDISTGKVLFQWNAADHVPYQDSEQPRPASAATPWDWFYINAVHLDTDGNLLISARHAWAVYKASPRTGNIIWVLGGKHSTFKLKAAPGQVLDITYRAYRLPWHPAVASTP
jgi:Arylsulfotransferase (ASST)